MIVVCNRIPVNPEHADTFEERFANRASKVDGMDGFISFQLLRPKNQDDPYVVMTFWETEAHFEAWTQSQQFTQGHARSGTMPKQSFSGESKMELFEVIQNTAEIVPLKK